MDRVKYQIQEFGSRRLEDSVLDTVLKDASDIYLSIRCKIDELDSLRGLIVKHIKSFEGWEYFIDTFNESHIAIPMFNWVKVLGDIIILGSSPLGLYDTLLYKEMGTCHISDLKNIETIIKERKEYYK